MAGVTQPEITSGAARRHNRNFLRMRGRLSKGQNLVKGKKKAARLCEPPFLTPIPTNGKKFARAMNQTNRVNPVYSKAKLLTARIEGGFKAARPFRRSRTEYSCSVLPGRWR